MLFAILCDDKPVEGLALRLANRPDHLVWLEGLGSILKFAGPFMDDGGENMSGSLIVIEADDIETARGIAAQDPFNRAGVFQDVSVRTWNWTVNNPDGA